MWLNQSAEPTALLNPTTARLHAVTNIDYNAKGQRTQIDYGTSDGKLISTIYNYDPYTFRLIHLYTRRGVDPLTRESVEFTDDCENPQSSTIATPDVPPPGKPCGLQNVHYTYDPIGNITQIRDDAQDRVFHSNTCVLPGAEYRYDALYRLMAASGREHKGDDQQYGWDDSCVLCPRFPTTARRCRTTLRRIATTRSVISCRWGITRGAI